MRPAPLAAPAALAALAVLLMVGACAPARYVKAGADEVQVAADLAECRDIAARQAFRDLGYYDHPTRLGGVDALGRRRTMGVEFAPSLGELEQRYLRVCMMSRGYELKAAEDP